MNGLSVVELKLIVDALNNEIARLTEIPRYGRAHDMAVLRDKLQDQIDAAS
jgi:hypothetical protein